MTFFIPTATEQTNPQMALTSESTTSTWQFSRARSSVPIVMPSRQEFYWHRDWQQGERETLDSFAAGNCIRFDSDDPEDIVRWLHAPEDSDSDRD